MKIPAKGFTHGGKFHADDVFSTALLQILRPDIQVTRGFVVPDDFDGIVYDVGGGMFDHHSEPRECRPNGVPYAAFGLLWRLLGAQLVGEHQARLLDENFIQPLDLNDNTGEQNSLADAIGSFNPLWDSKDDPDECFWRAVPVAKKILENEIAAANAVNRADDTVRRACDVAQATEFIDKKQKKYDSGISQGGSNVSGGQKQRLSIARAVYRHPEILIFDDSFSALDFKTDRAVRDALEKEAKDSTKLIVAQRIGTIMNADRIIVLDDGKVVGQGTHEELLDTCEVYRQIAESQLSEDELKR